MAEYPSTWCCDTCKKQIDKPSDGMVVWRTLKNGLNGDFRIVHRGDCDFRQNYPMSVTIQDFIGCDGLSSLLDFVSDDSLLFNGKTNIDRDDLSDFINLIRRLHIPGFEEKMTQGKTTED